MDRLSDISLQQLLERLHREFFSPMDESLIKMALSPSASQKELDGFLEDWDIEAEGARKALLLSYFMKEHPELVFPPYVGPRLSGLLNYYKFRNIKLISQFRKICGSLREEGIDFVALKGGAMKHLRPDLSRVMSDIDILIPEKHYRKAGIIAGRLGYECHRDAHSIDLHVPGSQDGVMDIHRYIHMGTGRERNVNDGIFARAVKAEVFGVEGYIPCHEDLAFVTLVNLTRNIMDKTSSEGLIFSFFDIHYLACSKKGFDWNLVLDDAVRSGSAHQAAFAAMFLNSVVPGLVPERLFEAYASGPGMDDFRALVVLKRYVLTPLQARSHQLGVGTVLRNPRLIPDFIRVRPQYTFKKLLRDNPAAARLFIRLHDNKQTR